jgi:autotransporter-associated beta strand protein
LVLFFALLFCAMGISFALAKATASTTLATTMAVDNFAPQSVINKRTLLYEPTNTAPTLDAIADPAPIDQDAAIQMVNLTGITAGGSETQTLTVTATSANSALVPHPAVTYTSPDTTGSLRYTPVTGASGSTVITVTVDDGQAISATTTQTFTVVVKPATVYVSPTFTDTAGTSIPDADLGLAGDQAATQASTAFATINAALAAAATNGTIIVNGGSYSETVTLNTSQTLKISGADVNQTVILSDLSTSAAVTVTIDGASTLTFGDEDNRTLAGLISGSGNLVKQGSGMATLANSNTYSGLTTVNAGTLRVTVNAALGSPASGTTVASGATLDLRNVTYSTAESLTLGGGALSNSGVSTTTFAGAVTMTANSNFGTGNSGSSLLILNGVVTGNFVLNKRNAGTLRLLNTSNSFRSFIIAGGVVQVGAAEVIADTADMYTSSVFDLNGFDETMDSLLGNGGVTNSQSTFATLTVGAGNSDSDNRLFGPITGAIHLVKTGAGRQLLGSTSSTYSGTTTINSGRLTLNPHSGATTMQALGSIAGNTILNAAGTLEMDNVTYLLAEPVIINGGTILVSYGTNSFPGPLTLATGTATINTATNTQVTLSGVISGDQGFTKTGNGVLIISGVNTYTGATTINGGRLLVNGSTAVASTVTVNSGGTLGGVGTVSGAVTIASGGAVAPGLSPGILNTGDATFTSGATFKVEINGTTVGAQYDQLNVTGAVALGNATLSLSGSYTPVAGDRFTLINNDGTDAVTGAFNGLAEGADVTLNGVTLFISYLGGDGNDVVLAMPRCFATPDDGTTLFQTIDAQAVQQGVDAATTGDTVKIAGACVGTTLRSGSTQLVYIDKELTLAGGYTTTDWLTSDPAANPTTLDADSSGRVIYAIEPLTVENLIVQNGLVEDGDGGGIRAFGDLTITDSTIRDNVATSAGFDSYGGGVSALGLVNVSGSTFSNNAADYDGGGLYVMGMLAITDTTFLSNTAGARGGGLHIYGNIGVLDTEFDPSRLTGVTFQNNSASGGGGGAYLRNGARMTGLNFFDNTAATGGALFFAGITTTPIEVINSRFGRNHATTNQGDVIYLSSEYPAQVDLLHNTLVNSVPTGGSALYLNMGSLNLTNTIVASHTIAIQNSGGTVAEDYNLFYANDTNLSGAVGSGGHSLVGDPAFVDPANDDYDLSATSQALDRGTDGGIDADWEGDSRPQGNGFDIGADEAPYTAPYLCFATLDGNTIYQSFTAQAVQDAVAVATAGDTVKLAGDCQGALPLVITIPLTLSGGYTTSNWLTPDLTTYPTTLDGAGSTRVLSITGEIAVTLQGLTLQNGDAGADDGGCLYIDHSTVTLNDTTITGCQAVDGGGVRVGSTLILNAGTVISGNTATGNGGGILVNGTPTATLIIQGGEVLSNTAVNGGGVAVLGSGNVLTMTSGAISYNVAQGVDSADDTGGDGLGGGLYNTGAVWLTGGVLQTNRAAGGSGGSLGNDGGANGGNGRGGAIYNDGVASLTVANVTLAENAAWGGAIANSGALTLSDTELRNNLAQGGNGGRGRFDGGYGGVGLGGALALWGSDPLSLNNVQLLTNTVQGGDGDYGADLGGDGGSGSGGALFSEPPLTITASRFQGNGAVAGVGGGADGGSDGLPGRSTGGAVDAAETLVITATSFFSNSAESGGAIYQYNSDFAVDMRVVNTVFAHNAAWFSSTGAAIEHNADGNVVLIHNTIGPVGAGTPSDVAAVWLTQLAAADVTNTIMVGHDIGIANNDGAVTVTGAGNLFYGNATADTSGNFAPGFALPSGDPAFVDAATDDYRLTSSSAAIERGVDAGLADDFDGALRPQGIAPDAGAFESSYTARCFATADSGATVHLSPDSMAVRSAIAGAVTLPSSEVRVAGSCEGVTTNSGTTQLALITQTLTLRGGYTTTDWLTSDPDANPTTLDALRSGRVIRTSHPLTVENLLIQNGQATNSYGGGIYAGSTLLLSNSTISNSIVTGLSPNGNGGGLWVNSAATITGSHFLSNRATLFGGGAYIGGAATITATSFLTNTADRSGGGAYVNGTAHIHTSSFQANQATTDHGAGLYVNSTATINNVSFLVNHASDNGGGLYVDDAATITGTTFLSNTVGSYGGGAIIFGRATITGATFLSNTASIEGGGLYADDQATITGSQFSNNRATLSGGGAYSFGAATLTATQFYANRAGVSGGGAYLNGAATVSGSGFYSNTASTSGGGAYLNNTGTIARTTFQGNRSTNNVGGGLYARAARRP